MPLRAQRYSLSCDGGANDGWRFSSVGWKGPNSADANEGENLGWYRKEEPPGEMQSVHSGTVETSPSVAFAEAKADHVTRVGGDIPVNERDAAVAAASL